MSTVINTNLLALNTQLQLQKSAMSQQTAMARLSSGLRINSAKDDAAGLAISNRMTSQTKGLAVAVRNAGDAQSLSQTAEGALSSIGDNLQRIRELALQSANGTNTAADRQSIQVEVQQLKDQIQSVATDTNFNGKKLLDGTFGTTVFQTGANVGQTISVAISGATTAQMGSGQNSGISTAALSLAGANGGAAHANSMAAGDLIINGVQVGAALAGADGASSANQDHSSIAIAAAINLVSTQSNVTAVVNANTVKGTAIAAGVAMPAAAVAMTLNGTTINISGSGDANNLLSDLQGAVDAINLKQGQTGVTASIDPKNLGAGISLTAADGRNIVIGGAAATTYGIGAADTYSGSVTLVSQGGADITITSNTGESLENVGIETGTYSASQASAVSSQVSNSGNAMATGDLVINGIAVGGSYASYDTASTANQNLSAIAIAHAINLVSDTTGVTAKAGPTTVTSTGVSANTGGAITINGVSITTAAGTTGTTAEQVSLYVDAINAKSAQTGVHAVVNDASKFSLVADDGRNIETTALAGAGLAAASTKGSIQLSSGNQINLSTNTGDIENNTGLTVGTYGSGTSGQLVQDIDVSTVAGANLAVQSVDNALAFVNAQRANMGAVQNRLDSTISNLQLNSQNLTSANSRITDADFAVETGNLSRSQILQQAGTAMLAQANSSTQGVLSLLR